jgi:ABC-type nitrate/sulfonate/bicarbonate transport system substrate-binding protein
MMFNPSDKKGHSFLRIVFALVLISGLLAGSTSCQKQEKQTGPREKATIGVASVVAALPIIVAQEKGYFSDEGLDVTFKFYPSGKKAMEGMFAGEADIATSAETPILHNSFFRDDFVVLATFAYSYDDAKVLGREDKGVSKPSDLKGKKIGTVAGTGAHFFAHLYLAEHGIDLSAVTMVDIAPADLPGALKDGKVDAIVVWEPVAYQVKKALPDKIVKLPKSDLYKETFNLAAMRSYANGHPGGLIKMLKAVDRATIFIKQNKKEATAVMAKVLKLDEDVLNSTVDDFVFELSLEDSLLITLEDEARWAMKNGFTDKTKVPNYLGYVYPDAMKAIKPEAVTIIK